VQLHFFIALSLFCSRILTFWGRLLSCLTNIPILYLHPKSSINGALNQSNSVFHSFYLYANRSIQLLCKEYTGHYLSRFHTQISLGVLSFYLCFASGESVVHFPGQKPLELGAPADHWPHFSLFYFSTFTFLIIYPLNCRLQHWQRSITLLSLSASITIGRGRVACGITKPIRTEPRANGARKSLIAGLRLIWRPETETDTAGSLGIGGNGVARRWRACESAQPHNNGA